MKILIAPDKFKGCLDALAVAEAIGRGVRAASGDVEVDSCPLADGGEGTVRALVSATRGRLVTQRVTGPLPHMRVEAEFGLLGNAAKDVDPERSHSPLPTTAVIEMSAASGLALLRPGDRDPMSTTTFGTGELLKAAAEMGVERIILGIGGSATVDAGVGCAQAAGLTVLLVGGEPVSMTEPLCGRDLDQVILVKRGRGSPVDHCRITVACDVTNPLYGEEGAAVVFGPQKGATAEQVRALDDSLRRLAQRLGKDELARTPGAGAAGGLGFGMLAFFNAELKRGIELVLEAVNFRERLKGVDLCITGEGRFDRQSLAGKTPVGVARVCREMGVPCVVVAGSVEVEAREAEREGVTEAVGISDPSVSVEESMQEAPELLRRAGERVVRSFLARRKQGR